MRNPASDKGRDTASFTIAGVGASAGGLDAFGELVDGLPENLGCAIVFVQHVPPDHESLLPGLLRDRRPDLQFVEPAQNTVAKPGHVYLAPASRRITIHNGVLHLGETVERQPSSLIDTFLISLADECHERAVGVILSGAGYDGTKGVAAIRAEGGCVVVQDPATARFPSMPRSAIETGSADLVLAPAAIARSVTGIGDVCRAASRVGELSTERDMRAFFEVLYEITGYRFEHYKQSVVERRVRRRMHLRGVTSVRDYVTVLREDPSEARQAATDLMIGVTAFFRDPQAWETLKEHVVRPLIRQGDDEPIRVWTPACSTGEESYSIAMMLADELRRAGDSRDFVVFASDINDAALEKARRGVFAIAAECDIPQDYRREYTVRVEQDSAIAVNKDIRSRMVFAKHSILGDPPFSKQDLIICRNLLIYLDPGIQQRCIDTFHYALRENQYLFLGKAENVSGGHTLFRALEPRDARIYRRLPGPSPTRYPSTIRPTADAPPHTAPRRQTPGRSTVVDAARDVLLATYAPAAVAIDKHYSILYNSGPVNSYLAPPPGEPTTDLLEQLPSRLRTRIRGAVHRATQDNETVVLRTSLFRNRGALKVSIAISRLEDSEEHYLVVFETKGSRGRGEKRAVSEEPADGERDTRMRRLEDELTATRLDLQQHVEQLRHANDELQSSNEELTVSNEELETSREELQSLNEELVTVNGQLQAKMAEQEQTNNDLVNFQTGTDIPALFLDQVFRVRRFTPAMTRLIGFIPADLGRSLADLAHENLGPDLMENVNRVLKAGEPVSGEIEVGDEWFIRAIQPYRTTEGRIEGVVVTFADVTGLKQAQKQLQAAAERFRIVADFTYDWEYWWGLDKRFVYVTPSCERVTGYSRDELMADPGLYARIVHPDDRERIVDHLAADPKQHEPERLEFRIVRRDGEVRWMDHVCQPVVGDRGQVIGRRSANRDITDRKRFETALRDERELLKTVFDSIPVMLTMYEPSLDILWLNRTVYETTGWSEDDVARVGIMELVYPDAQYRAHVADYMQSLQPGFRDIVMRCKDGGVKETSWANIRLPDGRQVGIGIDISQRKTLEQQLQARADELVEANQDLESFAYSVSHDLRNPLNNIGMLVKVLGKRTAGTLDEDGRKSMDYIEKNLARMSGIITDLLTLSRVSRHELQMAQTDLGALARGFVDELRRIDSESEVEVVVHEDMSADADSRLMKIVLENLIRNAWKYTSKVERPRIEVGMERQGSRRVYFVQDNGAGFDMQDAQRIFAPFQRAHSDKQYQGSGIGLSIVKRIVRKHGGDVWAVSATGEGARFSFTLP